MLVKEHEWKVPVLQELLSTRMHNLYVEGFDDYVITEMINMLYKIKKKSILVNLNHNIN